MDYFVIRSYLKMTFDGTFEPFAVRRTVSRAGTLLFCLHSICIHAQNKGIDSLKSILPGASTFRKIEINYRIASRYQDILPDSAMHYYHEALRLSRQAHNDTFAAKSLDKIGQLYYNSGEYEKAIWNLYSALKLFERYQDKFRAMRCLQYIGMAYNEQGMHDKALDYAKQSLEMAKTIGDKRSAAVSMTNIGSVYYAQGDFDKALEYFEQALHTFEEIKDHWNIPDALNNLALIYEEKKNPGKALELLRHSLALVKEMGDSKGAAAMYHNIGLVYNGMGKFPVAIKYLDSGIALAKEGDDKFYLKESYKALSEAYSGMGNFVMAYKTHLLFSNLNDTLMSEENKKQFAEMNTKYETEKKDKKISLLNKDKIIQEEEIQQQQIVRNVFIGGFAVVLLFAGVFFRQRNKIKKGKQQSDELLLNILPAETAEELKLTGEAQTKLYDEVTVMFTDFKDFTQTSEKLSATELVQEIHHCYSEFDKIISRHGLEKIKTIGDSYMCAGGLPVPNHTNAEDIVKAALEIREFMFREKQEHEAAGKPFFEIRIGCHTGPVVAGIVGIKKFAYDIWGDTVNTASRMESSGESGKVNISGATHALVKDKFVCNYRGKVQAKHKGEIDMYFVENPQPMAEENG